MTNCTLMKIKTLALLVRCVISGYIQYIVFTTSSHKYPALTVD